MSTRNHDGIIAHTPRLIIRPYREDDLDTLFSLLSDSKTMSFWPAPFSREQAQAWLNKSIASYASHGFGRWAVELKDSGRFIGDAGLQLSELDGKEEHDLGYIILAPYWNYGYATEAAMACLQYGIKEKRLRRICANMPYDHISSRAVAEKIGMTFEKQFFNARNRNILTHLFSTQVPAAE